MTTRGGPGLNWFLELPPSVSLWRRVLLAFIPARRSWDGDTMVETKMLFGSMYVVKVAVLSLRGNEDNARHNRGRA